MGALEGIVDKKIYVWAQDGPGGEKIQFAISITAPKTPVTCGGEVGSVQGAWSDALPSEAPAGSQSSTPVTVPTEISAADKEKVKQLMETLGIKD